MNKIHVIQDTAGVWMHEEQQIKEAFVSYYQGLLGINMTKICNVKQQVINEGFVITKEQQSLFHFQCNFTIEDVKKVMFSIPNEKAPGSD